MKRKALLKAGDDIVVLEESRFEAETQLQEAPKLNRRLPCRHSSVV